MELYHKPVSYTHLDVYKRQIEAGGTKFVVAIGDENGNIIERDAFPTTTPDETVANIFKFFDGKDIEALGLGCFGPDVYKRQLPYILKYILFLFQNYGPNNNHYILLLFLLRQ